MYVSCNSVFGHIGVQVLRDTSCPVTRHRAQLCRSLVHILAAWAGSRGLVEGELVDKLAVSLGNDPKVQVPDQDQDFGTGPAAVDADVVESAVA